MKKTSARKTVPSLEEIERSEAKHRVLRVVLEATQSPSGDALADAAKVVREHSTAPEWTTLADALASRNVSRARDLISRIMLAG
jgi:hypothetical protein